VRTGSVVPRLPESGWKPRGFGFEPVPADRQRRRVQGRPWERRPRGAKICCFRLGGGCEATTPDDRAVTSAAPPHCGDHEVNPQLLPLLVSQTSDAVRPKSCYLLVSSIAKLSVGVCLFY
jgi:hypothetical protein